MLVGLASPGAVSPPLLPFALLAAGLAVIGLRTPVPEDATEADNAIAVLLAFPIAVLFTSAPYLAHGLSPLDAAFEGMSGVTSTGLTRFSEIGSQPFALHFLRAWQQFVGGYAIITLMVALMPTNADAAEDMTKADVADDAGSSGARSPDLIVRARRVLLVYLALGAACIVGVRLAGQDWAFALLHGLTSISTGGFSAHPGSLGDVSRTAVSVLMVFSVLGAVALSDYVRPATERAGARKLAGTLGAVLVLSAVFGLASLAAERASGAEVALFDILQVAASAQTTTGFSTLTVSDLSDTTKTLLIVSMSIGGDIGSTAGGVKLMRLVTLAVAAAAILRRVTRPHETPGGGARLAAALIAAWVFLTVAGGAALTAAGHAPIDAFFEAASALNNAGLSAGPSNGEDVPAATRVTLILLMWIGRAEILAVLLVLRAMGLRRNA